MEPSEGERVPTGWMDASGLGHLFRIPRLAVRLDALGLGIAGVILTVVLGTSLDWFGSMGGGISQDAIAKFIRDRQLGTAYVEPEGDFGIFQVWREHQRNCVLGLLGSLVPFKSIAGGTGLGNYIELHAHTSPLANIVKMGLGTWWLVREHFVYSVFLVVGLLVIWSWAGGGMCRIYAVAFARSEVVPLQDAERYARAHLSGGFLLAPLIPLGMLIAVASLLILGGVLLRIPWIGDLIAGASFFMALLGGGVVAILLVGIVTAGHLFWPAVAADSADGFDAFSRSFSYVLTRPARALFYAAVSTVLIAVCWIAANLFTFLSLYVTRAIVSFGTAPFGWWKGGRTESKLEALWPSPTTDALYQAPSEWGKLGVFEHVSAVCIALWVLLVVAMLWSFLASLYYSACTVCYFLLRRDVDATDLGDVGRDDDLADSPKPASSGT